MLMPALVLDFEKETKKKNKKKKFFKKCCLIKNAGIFYLVE